MRPIRPDGTQWSATDSNVILQHFASAITREINQRDIARGCPDNGAGVPTAVVLRGDRYEVDPRLARLKSPGSVWVAEVRRRWSAFCSEPRDPATELRKIGATPEPLQCSPVNMTGTNSTIAAAISEGIRAGIAAALSNGHSVKSDSVLTPRPPRKPPGRPRKIGPTPAEATVTSQ